MKGRVKVYSAAVGCSRDVEEIMAWFSSRLARFWECFQQAMEVLGFGCDGQLRSGKHSALYNSDRRRPKSSLGIRSMDRGVFHTES